MKRVGSVAAALAVLLAAGCSSSGGGRQSTPPSRPPSAPVRTTPSTSTPPPSPTTSAPLSPYEADPAVQALRAWAAEAARTVNTGHYDSPALDALMTPAFRNGIRDVLGGELGHRYPGPIPFTPTQVVVASSTERDIHACIVDDGFSLNPKTGKPYAKYHVQAFDAKAQLVNGRWLVASLGYGTFSCSEVKIREVPW